MESWGATHRWWFWQFSKSQNGIQNGIFCSLALSKNQTRRATKKKTGYRTRIWIRNVAEETKADSTRRRTLPKHTSLLQLQQLRTFRFRFRFSWCFTIVCFVRRLHVIWLQRIRVGGTAEGGTTVGNAVRKQLFRQKYLKVLVDLKPNKCNSRLVTQSKFAIEKLMPHTNWAYMVSI